MANLFGYSLNISQAANKLLGKVGDVVSSKQDSAEMYSEVPDNWYRALPYAFKANFKEGTEIFYLPISPKNLTITTHFATNMIATLYSTVEEHSEQRYFDITISGTTGFSPQYVNSSPYSGSSLIKGNSGRTSYEFKSAIFDEVKGLFPKTIAKVENALNQVGNTFKAFSNSNNHEIGVFNNTSGYQAFHNLYKFLLKHKKEAASQASSGSASFLNNVTGPKASSVTKSPLQFVNYKDNNQYSCVVQRFVLERNAENPMLYDYVINLKAYNLSSITKVQAPDLEARFADLGLDSAMSYAAKTKVAIKSGKSAVTAGKGALKTLGA
jgi:hypothetical protein